KETIDKPAPKTAKPFVAIPAWYIRHGNTPVPIEVTSIAEKGYGSGQYVWIKNGKQRSKEGVEGAIFPRTDRNDELCRKIETKLKEGEQIENEIRALHRSLLPLVI